MGAVTPLEVALVSGSVHNNELQRNNEQDWGLLTAAKAQTTVPHSNISSSTQAENFCILLANIWNPCYIK